MHFEKERTRKILDVLGGLIFRCEMPIAPIFCYAGREKTDKPITFTPDMRWGGYDRHYRFVTDFTVPESYGGKRVDIRLTTGREKGWDATNPQFLLLVNGAVKQGMDVNHTDVTLTHHARAGEAFHLEFIAYSGTIDDQPVAFNLRAAIHSDAVERIYYNLKAPHEAAYLFREDDKRYWDIVGFLTNTVNKLDLREPFSDAFYRSIDEANAYIESAFYEDYCGHEDSVALCVGHTHIDVAWLWRLAETEDKVERSFATVLSLMEEYPEYIFMSSQPQLYQYIKTNNPIMYEAIKARIAEGRWEAEGAMWLEPDCNLASGEALVRQMIHGKRFFRSEFGVDNKLLWLPDVFGYSAALPQIMKKSGVDYFVTSKISWNEYNHLPYDTFLWQGIDGTEVLTQFITTKETAPDMMDTSAARNSYSSTYSAKIVPSQLAGGFGQYQQKNINHELIVPYGYGDGGGGTTRADLEMARRLGRGIPGVPKVKLGTARDFMERLDARVRGQGRLPKWVGELYLEFHRGTYTSMARNKRYNRKCEYLLQHAEWANTLSCLLAGGDYPGEMLDQNWETVLLNQFHDILPGSSIEEVYKDSQKQYEQVTRDVSEAYRGALTAIAKQVSAPDHLVVFNPTAYVRTDVVDIDGRLVTVRDIPPMGYRAVSAAADDPSTVRIEDKVLSNRFFCITFHEDYSIAGIYDKRAGREVLSARGNVLQAFEDLPHNYDNWDLNIYYGEKTWPVDDVDRVEQVDRGAAKGVKIRRKFLSSVIEQTILLYDDVDRIDFETYIDWKQEHVVLKAAFPVKVHSDKASYDIQYGNVERPTHWNTSWDKAKFEVCAHKWADLSEDGYGVSLLNDSKYGHDIKDGVMRLTLLKSGTYPNPVADQEEHRFVYSLYPHEGGWRAANTPRMAYALNCPLQVAKAGNGGDLPATLSLVAADKPNAVVEVVKRAYNGEGIIVRLYDCFNRTETVTLTLPLPIKAAYLCDLLENNEHAIEPHGNGVTIQLDPYEIKTLRLQFS